MRSIITALALTTLASAAFADHSVTHSFISTTPASTVRSLLIDIPAGEIRVLNGRPGEIRISGAARRDYDSWEARDANQKIVDDITVETYAKNDEAVIRRRFGPNAQSWRSQKFSMIEATIEVPPGTSVVFETSFGEIHMEGRFGNVDIDLRAGEIHLTTPRADVRELNASCRIGEVHTNLGHEIVVREGLFPGRTHFENPSGRTRVNVHVTTGEAHVTLTQ